MAASPVWRWAWRDLRAGARQFRLVFFCLALSIMAITAVHVGGASVTSSISENARIILGGDWVVRQLFTPVGQAERDFLKKHGAIFSETVEARVMIANPKTDDATLVELKAVDDAYPLYGEASAVKASLGATLEKGIVLDAALATRLDIGAGDAVRLGDTNFTVADWIGHEPDRAGGGRFGLAPRVFISKADWKKTGFEKPGSMIYHDLRIRFPEGFDTKALKKEFEKAFPDATWRLTDTEKASPQIQRFVNNVVQFLTLIGLSALLIGGIGVANGIRAYLQSRLTSIAIFKAVGMPLQSIRQIYLIQIAWIGLLATIAGIIAGAAIPVLFVPMIQDLLPFPLAIRVTPQALVAPFLFGILTTFMFALWPLGIAERISALTLFRSVNPLIGGTPGRGILMRIALLGVALSIAVLFSTPTPIFAAFFLVGAAICFALFYGFGRMLVSFIGKRAHSVGFIYRLALGNLARTGNATAQTLISLGIGLTVLVSIAMIERNLSATLRENLPEDAPAFFFLDIQPDQKEAFSKLVSDWPTARKLILMPNLRGRLVAVNDVPAEDALIDQREAWLLNNDRGFTYTAEQPAHSVITAGEWWPTDYAGPPLVSVVDDVQRGFGVKVGDKLTVEIMGRRMTATIANVREVNWTTMTVNFAMTFAPGMLEGAPHSNLATVVADPAQETALMRAVVKAFPNVSMIRLSDAINAINDLLGQMNQAVRVMALLALATGVMVLAQALIATRAQRLYDTTILKMIGTPRRLLVRAMFVEFGLLGGIAASAAAVLGTVISWSVMDLWMDLPWKFYAPVALGVAVLGWLIIVLTSWASLYRLLRRPALGFLRNE